MYGKMKKKTASMKKMYMGGGIELDKGVVDMFRKGGVETRSVKRPAACMPKKKK